MAAIPVLGEKKDRLQTIPGIVPQLIDLPEGCRFASRCEAKDEHGLSICDQINPDLEQVKEDHYVRCWLYQDHEDHKAIFPMPGKGAS